MILSLAALAVFFYLLGQRYCHSLHSERMELKKNGESILAGFLAQIQNIKIKGWETFFRSKAVSLNSQEVTISEEIAFARSFNNCIPPLLSPLCCLVCFAVITLYEPLPLESTFFVFFALSTLHKSMVSITETFIDQEELGEVMDRLNRLLRGFEAMEIEDCPFLETGAIRYEDCTLSSPTYLAALLPQKNVYGSVRSTIAERLGAQQIRGLNLEIAQSDFCVIQGDQYEGTSMLIQSILGNMSFDSGNFTKRGEVAYIPEQPFIISDTIKQNILFGLEFSPHEYYNTIDICQLRDDLLALPLGDRTQIGEGLEDVHLSKDTYQKIAIARAVYANTEIYLFENSLEVLSVNARNRIINRVLVEHLHDKTRVLVASHLPEFHRKMRFIVLDDGELILDGFYEQSVNKQQLELFGFKLDSNCLQVTSRSSSTRRARLQISPGVLTEESSGNHAGTQRFHRIETRPTETLAMEPIEVKSGLAFYTVNLGVGWFLLLIPLYLLSVVALIAVYYLLASWSLLTFQFLTYNDYFWFSGFSFFVAFTMSFARLRVLGNTSITSGKRLFTQLVDSAIRRPLSYFNRRTVDKLLESLFVDYMVFESGLVDSLDNLVVLALTVLAIFILAIFACFPLFLIIFVVVVGFQSFLRMYVAAVVNFKRMGGVARLNMLGLVGTFMDGFTSLKIFGYSRAVIRQWEGMQNTYACVNYHQRVAKTWMTMVTLGGSFVTALMFTVILIVGKYFR